MLRSSRILTRRQQPAYPNQGQPQSYPDQSGQQLPLFRGSSRALPSKGSRLIRINIRSGGPATAAGPPGRVAGVVHGGAGDNAARRRERQYRCHQEPYAHHRGSRLDRQEFWLNWNVGDGFLRMVDQQHDQCHHNNVQTFLLQRAGNYGQASGEGRSTRSTRPTTPSPDSPVFTASTFTRMRIRAATVRSGYGEATGKGVMVRVNSGEQMRFNGGTSLRWRRR